jgi:hypothetical protein
MSVSAPTAITVSPVASKKDRDAFLRLPWRLQGNDPNWVPNLLLLQHDLISEKKNPFFDHGEAQLFLARRDETVVGRISANIDRRHLELHHEQTGFFGFFEAENDPEVAKALFAAAEAWLRERGMTASRGPFGFSIDQEVGLLVEGFDYPPMIDMTHAPPYYGPLVESAGYAKAMDLFAYKWEIKDPPERMMEAIRKTQAVPGLTVRKVRMNKLKEEVGILLDIYKESWNQNWGYVDVTERAANKMADDLRLIADPNVVLIAEMNGEPAGMVVGIPNLYEVIRDFKGFIDPIKAIKLLWRLKIKGPETGRLLLFGVKPKFRTRELYGLPFLLLYELYLGAKKKNYKWCEESWVLETNGPLNAMMPYWDAYVYKKYRIYEKALI